MRSSSASIHIHSDTPLCAVPNTLLPATPSAVSDPPHPAPHTEQRVRLHSASEATARQCELRLILIDSDTISLQRHQRFVAKIPNIRVTAAVHSITVGAHHLLSRPDQHDLVIFNVTPQNHMALRLMRQMRVREISTPALVISSIKTPEMLHKILALGAIDYLVTPLTFDFFADRIRQARWYCEQRAQHLSTPPTAKFSQQQFDEVLESHHPRGCHNRFNGLSPETLELVHHTLRESPQSTASVIARNSHTSRVTARRYLEHLVSIGVARRSPQHGRVGRPSSVYEPIE